MLSGIEQKHPLGGVFELWLKKEYTMKHEVTIETFSLKGWEDGGDGFSQATCFYSVDGTHRLATAVGNNAGEAVANLCSRIHKQSNVPLLLVVELILPLALALLFGDDPPPDEVAAEDLPF